MINPEDPIELELDNAPQEQSMIEEVSVEDEPEEAPFAFNEDSPNLVADFRAHPEGAEALKQIVNDCYDNWRDAWDKNDEYRSKCAENWALLYGKHKPKSPPYEGAPNPHVPLMLTNITRLTNRIQMELFADWRNVFNFVPMSPQGEQIAPIVTEHINWQIQHRIPGFKRNMARGIWIYCVNGDVVSHTYYDSYRKTNTLDILTCDDFCTPYTHVSVAPDFCDVPWLAKRTQFFKAKLHSMSGEWDEESIEKITSKEPNRTDLSDAEKQLRDEVADYHGEHTTSENKEEYEIIQWEGWLRLPSQERDRYCQVIFDLDTKAPLKLAIHERAPYYEKARFEYQMQEFQQYQMQMQQYQEMLMAHQQQIDDLYATTGDLPQDSALVTEMVIQARQAEQEQPPPPPMAPAWLKEGMNGPEEPKKEPIYMFGHGVCLEPMLGNLGIGIGTIDADYNKAANVAMSLFIDAAVLSNGKTFITAGNVDFKSPFRVAPGYINKAKNVMPSDLKNAFLPLDFGGANPQLFGLVDKLLSFGEAATQTPDVMSGAPGKSGETARGIQARLEQVATMLTVPAQRYGEFTTQIGKNLAKLNAVFLNDYEAFYCNRFNDSMSQGGPQMVQVMREHYDNEFDIQLNSDMQFRTRAQKISEADELTQLANAVPEMQMNLFYKQHTIRESLKARGQHALAKFALGPPAMPPQTPLGVPMGPPPGQAGPPQGQGNDGQQK